MDLPPGQAHSPALRALVLPQVAGMLLGAGWVHVLFVSAGIPLNPGPGPSLLDQAWPHVFDAAALWGAFALASYVDATGVGRSLATGRWRWVLMAASLSIGCCVGGGVAALDARSSPFLTLVTLGDASRRSVNVAGVAPFARSREVHGLRALPC